MAANSLQRVFLISASLVLVAAQSLEETNGLPNEGQESAPCPGIDLVILVDSGMDQTQFKASIRSLQKLMSFLPLGPQSNMVGVSSVGDSYVQQVPLVADRKRLQNGLSEINPAARGDVGDALKEIDSHFNQNGRKDARRLILFYSDGLFLHPDNAEKTAIKLRRKYVSIMGVVMGLASSPAHMETLVSDPIQEYMMEAMSTYYSSKVLPVEIFQKFLTSVAACPIGSRVILEKCKPLEKSCDGTPVDIVFLVDTSSSISVDQLQTFTRVMNDLSSRFRIAQHSARVGLATIDSQLNVLADLSTAVDSKRLAAILKQITFTNTGESPVAQAVTNVGKLFDSKSRSVLVLMTDGAFGSPTSTEAAANELRKAGVQILGLGFERAMNMDNMETVTGSRSRIFSMVGDTPDATEHDKLVSEMAKQICGGGGKCTRRRDVVLLIETRLAFSDAQCEKLREIAVGIASRMAVSAEGVRIAAATYSRDVDELFGLEESVGMDVVEKLKQADFSPGLLSNMHHAINRSSGIFGKTSRDVPKVVVLLTGGDPSRPTATLNQIKSILKDPNVALLGVALKQWVSDEKENRLSDLLVGKATDNTDEDRKNVFVMDPGTTDEKKFLDDLSEQICEVETKPPE